jgi:hypothetical protein
MRPSFIIAVAAGFAVLSSLSGPAWAQANRTFVSGHGSDTNPCSLLAPCRSFAQALTQTSSGGEVTILDPAGYGAVTINKAVSIVNDGVGEAGVTASSGSGITISAASSDVISLRGLTLVGASGSDQGVLFAGSGTLNMQNCIIRGFASGILLVPVGSAAFNVSDTIVSNVGSTGVSIDTGAVGTVTALFNRVQAIGAGGDGFRIRVDNAVALNVTITDSLATNNTNNGIEVVLSSIPALAQVTVSNSVVSNNGTGVINGGGNSTIYLTKNTIAGNFLAFDNTAGGLFSFGDNYIAGNTHDGFAIPLVSAK